MGNIRNFNFNKIDAFLSNSEYYDYYLTYDGNSNYFLGDNLDEKCLGVFIDFNDPDIYPEEDDSGYVIYSTVSGDTIGGFGGGGISIPVVSVTGSTTPITTGSTTPVVIVKPKGPEVISNPHLGGGGSSQNNNTSNNFIELNNFGFTGLDNGFLLYTPDPFTLNHHYLVDIITGSTLVIPDNGNRFIFTMVSGSTNQFIYPVEIANDDNGVGDYAKLCGGFYQGFWKLDGYDYEVLPTRQHNAWVAEFWLRRDEECVTPDNTLNTMYPNNEGFFFYMGTRAENKYWNYFTGNTSSFYNTDFSTDVKEHDIIFSDDNGFPVTLTPLTYTVEEIKNNFLIYGRSQNKDGNCSSCGSAKTGHGTKTVCDFEQGQSLFLSASTRVRTYDTNSFLIYGRANDGNCGTTGTVRTTGGTTGGTTGTVVVGGTTGGTTGTVVVGGTTGGTVGTVGGVSKDVIIDEISLDKVSLSGVTSGCCGQCGAPSGTSNKTVCDYDALPPLKDLDPKVDVYDNAIGFRITKEGAIGYRYLTMTGSCSGDTFTPSVLVKEGYSSDGVVVDGEWTHITIRFVMNEYYDDCELTYKDARKGKLMFYVNGLLKFKIDEFDEMLFRRLEEHKDKQIGVPYNFSLGGGTQGLLESMTLDGQDLADLGLAIETNFAGTFIGSISQFKFYTCDLNWIEIKHSYNTDLPRYT